MCSRRGVVLGQKFRLFTGILDADAFRVQAYALAGLSEKNPSWAHWPPRKVRKNPSWAHWPPRKVRGW